MEKTHSYKYYNGYNEPMAGMTTIQIDTDVRALLQALGRKGETYNAIIKRTIEQARYARFMNQQYEILENEKEWIPLADI